ncbi:hypothetical protein V502_11508 [Pseudogymnoascus sp. VKM F-4520 (FW-2644)]|nr:hypothetical protein V502_11508 [Pseudogymnoascus sp. VKM F-4520 (FW-2644)]
MTVVKVAMVGASGETGLSIVNALLESSTTKFDITALTRPASLNKSANTFLKNRGINIVPVDLAGPQEELVKLLSGVDIVISTIFAANLADEIPLADAAKLAGVKRFVPCAFATVAPPKGIMDLREKKEETLNHIQKICLPYTYIDVGWWYQITVPQIPSGRLDYAVLPTVLNQKIGLDGNVPNALTDLRDIGRYVARIITDVRTLNKKVFAYNEVFTQNQVYNLVEKLSGENLERKYVSEKEVNTHIEKAHAALSGNPADMSAIYALYGYQYLLSCGIRGDNAPKNAEYLGYLNVKDLYPNIEFIKLEDYIKDALEGKAKPVYEGRLLVDTK